MARLLVSVRSADEARKAVAAGASIIDVKEPSHGPLGRASLETWREVAAVVPADVPFSVALGELTEWDDDARRRFPPNALREARFAKVGLAGVGPDWADKWAALAESLAAQHVRWIAVVYTDWKGAGAPSPSAVLRADLPCEGVLFDTWDKARPSEWTPELVEMAEAFRESDRTLAVAGGLTRENLDLIAAMRPDVVAVRGAVCEGGDRLRDLDQGRVADLVKVVRELPVRPTRQPTSNRTPWARGNSVP